MLTYLKLAVKPVGLLINFNVPVLKDGVKRILNPNMSPQTNLSESPDPPSCDDPSAFIQRLMPPLPFLRFPVTIPPFPGNHPSVS